MVEKTYSPANGYAKQAVVIYGDTDSVMVNFKVDSVGEAMRLGECVCVVYVCVCVCCVCVCVLCVCVCV